MASSPKYGKNLFDSDSDSDSDLRGSIPQMPEIRERPICHSKRSWSVRDESSLREFPLFLGHGLEYDHSIIIAIIEIGN